MDWNTISPAVISAAVFAAFIAGVVNIVIAIFNSNRLKAIEKQRRSNDFTAFLYKEIFTLHKAWINAIHEIEYEGNGVWESQLRRFDMNNVFIKQMRLLICDNFFWNEIDTLFNLKETNELHLAILEAVTSENMTDEKRHDYSEKFLEFIELNNQIENMMKAVFIRQLQSLIEYPAKEVA